MIEVGPLSHHLFQDCIYAAAIPQDATAAVTFKSQEITCYAPLIIANIGIGFQDLSALAPASSANEPAKRNFQFSLSGNAADNCFM